MLRSSIFRSSLLRTHRYQAGRLYSSSISDDIRSKLTTELKAAMKSKDTVKSTTIRSVLSEVYSADKIQPQPLASSAIVSILRKAVTRRTDAAAEFDKALRADLAEKERKEVELLQALLPPLLPESDIDRTLQEVLVEQGITPGEGDPRKTLGRIFKAFYAKIDRSSVDPDLVKRRADALLSK